MIALLDINVLIALAWPNHLHHKEARQWFSANEGAGWATCGVTQSGFIRVSANPQVIPEARTTAEALALLGQMTVRPSHSFWSDDTDFTESEYVDIHRVVGHRQVTDAHLLAIALAHGGRLATLDRRISALLPDDLDSTRALEVIV